MLSSKEHQQGMKAIKENHVYLRLIAGGKPCADISQVQGQHNVLTFNYDPLCSATTYGAAKILKYLQAPSV